MAGLPPRPQDYDDRRHMISPDDRHYTPMSRSMAPMRPSYRDDRRDQRSRGYNTYIPGYNRRDDERHGDFRHEPDYRRDEDGRQWYKERNQGERRWDEDHYRGEFRRRGSEREGETWVASDYDGDRRRVHDRNEDRDRDRERDTDRRWDIERPPNQRRDLPHPRRDTRSPPRRTGPYAYPPDSRRPSASPRRASHYQPSPSYAHDRPHSRSHSTARSISRAASPPKRIKIESNSISNSPRSPARSEPVSPHHSPQRHSLPCRLPRASRSRSPERSIKDEPRRGAAGEQPSATPSPSKERPAASPTQTKTPTPRSPSPVKPEPIEEAPPPSEQHAAQDKGKLKEQPPTENGDIDVKMQDYSPSPPRHLKGAPSALVRRTSRTPPRGPRNHPKPPTAPASFYHPNTQARDWPHRNNTNPAWSMSAVDEPNPIIEPPLPVSPVVTLPMIPIYQTKPSITQELDAEIARIQAHRAHLVSDYVQVAKVTRRALHELDIATIDLRAAENRRKLADSQVEKARAGVLGIDAVQVS